MKRIEMNIIWQKEFTEGVQIAQLIFDYFCSGVISPIKDVILGIPVNCMQIDKVSDFENEVSKTEPCTNNLLINIVLANKDLANLDTERKVIKSLGKTNRNRVLVPFSFDNLGTRYIDSYQRGFKYENDIEYKISLNLKKRIKNIIDKKIQQSIPYLLRDILNACVNRYYNLVIQKSDTKLGVFISHTKSNEFGKEILTNFQLNLCAAIKEIDTFVDRTEIGMGEDFEKIIYKNVTTRAMIILLTDNMSAQEWCQREIFYAKKYLMPIIIVDAINRKDDRLFTYIGNVPLIKYNGNNIGEVYELFAFEVLSCLYNRFKYDFDENTTVLCRKVELLDIVATDFSKNKITKTKIIYPDPPIYWIENDIIQNAAKHYGITIHTPITRMMEEYAIKKDLVLISSSKDGINYLDEECCVNGIDYAVREITRYLIFNGFTIVNGGHFKSDGFNKLIIEQIESYKRYISKKKVYCINYVNAFTYKKEKDIINKTIDEHIYLSSRKGRKYTDYIRIILPPEKEMNLEKEEQLRLNRIRITQNCNLHIVIGGVSYSPQTGIVEEVKMSLENKTPVFLIGGYGYKARQLCKEYINTDNYCLLNNGLSLEENQKLAKEKDIDVILNLIFIGIKRLSRK